MHRTNITPYICIYLAFLNALPSNCASSSVAPFVFDQEAQITDAVAQQIHAQYPAFHRLGQNNLNKILKGLIDTFHSFEPKERICQTVALIHAGADPKITTKFKNTILERAVYYSPCNLIAYLLQKGADPYTDAGLLRYPIFFLCKTISMIKIFVQHGTDINANKDSTMLIHKITYPSASFNLIRYLIHCGAKINETDSWGRSALTELALYRAEQDDSIPIARLLLDAGVERDLCVQGRAYRGLTAVGILKKTKENPALESVITSYIPPLYNRAFYTLLAATHSTDPAVAERAKQDMNVLKSAHAYALRPEFHEPTD